MNKRPRSVTVICWFLIVLGSLALLAGLHPKEPEFRGLHPEPQPDLSFFIFLFYASFASMVLSGVLMLFGFGWARWFFHAWFGDVIVRNVLHSPAKMWPAILLFGVTVYFLYLPQARAFFQSRKAVLPQAEAAGSDRI